MNGRRDGPDRITRWRKEILKPRKDMTDSTRVLLFKLGEHMTARGIVSIPRSKLAEDLGIAPARVSERIAVAKMVGFLDTVRRGQPGVTAVYQAIFPGLATDAQRPLEARQEHSHLVREPGHDSVREPYLKSGSRGTPGPYPRGSTNARVHRQRHADTSLDGVPSKSGSPLSPQPSGTGTENRNGNHNIQDAWRVVHAADAFAMPADDREATP